MHVLSDFFSNTVACLSPVPQSDLLLSSSWDTTGRVWSLSSKQCVQVLQGNYETMCFNLDRVFFSKVTAKLSGQLYL